KNQVFQTDPLMPEAPIETLQRYLRAGSAFDLPHDIPTSFGLERWRLEIGDHTADCRGEYNYKDAKRCKDATPIQKSQYCSFGVWLPATHPPRDPGSLE